MRADKLVMAGVVGLGLFAVYKMFKTKATEPQTTTNDSLSQFRATPLTSLRLLGNPLQVRQGQLYRARLDVSAGVAPFTAQASASELKAALEQLGFTAVRVYMKQVDLLPSTWPADVVRDATSTTRWFSAKWGASSMALPRPKALELIWEGD